MIPENKSGAKRLSNIKTYTTIGIVALMTPVIGGRNATINV